MNISQKKILSKHEIEKRLLNIWSSVLKNNIIKKSDNFFDLGGNLNEAKLAVQIIKKELGEVVHVAELFRSPTIIKLAKKIDSYKDVNKNANITVNTINKFRNTIESQLPREYKKARAKNKRAIFILSSPRTGSTLLRVVFAGHPDMFSPPQLELLAFNNLIEKRRFFAGSMSMFQEGAIQALMGAESINYKSAFSRIKNYETGGLSVQGFYKVLQRSIKSKTLVDKSHLYPMSRNILERAEACFEEPLYIHLTRDPYSTVLSFIKQRLDQIFIIKQKESLRELAELTYIVNNQNIIDFLTNIPKERKISISFEKLVVSPTNTIQGVCKHFNIKYTPSMVNVYSNIKNKMLEGIKPATEMIGDPELLSHDRIVPEKACEQSYGNVKLFLSEYTRKVAEKMGYSESKIGITETAEISNFSEKNTVGAMSKNIYKGKSILRGKILNQNSRKTIHEVFEEIVNVYPDNTAVIFKNKRLTYKQLNDKADIFAYYLIKKYGIGPENICAVMVLPSIDMIIVLLAILKAGGAYLPIDTESPRKRVSRILKDSGAKIIIANTEFEREIKPIAKKLKLTILNPANRNIQAANKNYKYKNKAKSNNLCYVIYTSGTTGQPKGVMIEHWSVVNLVFGLEKIKITFKDIIIPTGPLCFDAHAFEIWRTLCFGSTLYLVSKEVVLNFKKLCQIICEQKITILWLTSSLFNKITHRRLSELSGIKQIVVGGEALDPFYIQRALAELPQTKIINGYGPTECTTFSLTKILDGSDIAEISAGRPTANTTAYILNKDLKIVAPGVVGELCISGHGLARGYFNDHTRTKRAFLKSPFKKGERLYKTGDLAKVNKNGNVVILSRVDNQVKLRGYRIEIEEIEENIKNIKRIKDAVVVVKEEVSENTSVLPNNANDKIIAAYYTTLNQKPISVKKISNYLKLRLPRYMIPKYFIFIKDLPLNISGKLDRGALPKPAEENLITRKYAAPKNKIEKRLIKIWKDILGVKKISGSDSFFDLGGDSLKIVEAYLKIKKEFKNITIQSLFDNPTIKTLAKIARGK